MSEISEEEIKFNTEEVERNIIEIIESNLMGKNYDQ